MPRKPERERTSIALAPSTKEILEDIKLSDGQESYDHAVNRLVKVYRAAEARGLLQELAAA